MECYMLQSELNSIMKVGYTDREGDCMPINGTVIYCQLQVSLSVLQGMFTIFNNK